MASPIPEPPYQRFQTYEQLTETVNQLAAARPQLCRLSSLGRSREGREIHLLTLTDTRTGEAEDKPGYLVHGNIHAAELAGSYTALVNAWQLLTDPEAAPLLETTTFYIVPRLNPDGAEEAVTQSIPIRSRRQVDETAPNTLYPEDIDGDGWVVMMLKEDPAGDHCFDEEDPRLLRRRYHDSRGPFYRFYHEGMIHNWDGGDEVRLGCRGYDWNRNWSYDWRPEPEQSGAGDFPFSEPEMRHLAEFAMARENLFAMVDYHTGGVSLLTPPSTGRLENVDAGDRRVLEEIAEEGGNLMEMPVYPVVKLGPENKPDLNLRGHSEDFVYRHRGIHGYGIELGTKMESAGLTHQDRRQVPSEREKETLWRQVLSWYDKQDPETREPLFVDWHPFDHPQIGEVLVGGFISSHQQNQAPEDRRRLAKAVGSFVQAHARWAPSVRIEEAECEAVDSTVFRVRARVANRGRLPTHVTEPGKRLRCVKPVRVDFRPSPGVELLSRVGHVDLGHLPAVTGGQLLEWFVRTDGTTSATVTLRVRGGAGGNDARTVALDPSGS